jgi:hypothetical protein
VSVVLLDDHLLRDVLSDERSDVLLAAMSGSLLATTNLYLHRLCKSVVSARGGSLTGSWSAERRRELGRQLLRLPDDIDIVPIRLISYRMAEIADAHRVSTLGAEAVAATEHLSARLLVWDGDDGPGIRSAMEAFSLPYSTVTR